MERCCGFTIETGGVIVATKNALEMLYAIFYSSLLLMMMVQYFSAMYFLLCFVLLILAIGVLCISILSIRGIEARNHRYIIPMMIWLVIAVLISLVLLMIVNFGYFKYIWITLFFLAFAILCIALDVFGIVVMYSLYKKFRVQPTPPLVQYNEQPLQYSEKV